MVAITSYSAGRSKICCNASAMTSLTTMSPCAALIVIHGPPSSNCAEFLLRQAVAPLGEGTFGVLHDVAFVDQSHTLALVINRVLKRPANQALSPFD